MEFLTKICNKSNISKIILFDFYSSNEQSNSKSELPTQSVIPVRQPTIARSGSGATRITPYSDVTGLQTVKKDGKVLRPMNAFIIWSKSYRKELIAKG